MKVLYPVSEELWQEFLSGCEYATFFHSPHWAKLICATIPGTRDETRIFELKNGTRILLPLIVSERLSGLMLHAESMPFGTYGGPIGPRVTASPEEFSNMLDILKDSFPRLYSISITPNPLAPRTVPSTMCTGERFVQVVRFNNGGPPWKQSINSKTRYHISKAEKRGVSIQIADDVESFLELGRLYQDVAQHWKTKNFFTENFFRALADVSREHVQLWTATREGRLVAGLVVFVYGKSVTPYLSMFDRRERQHAANNLLYYEMLSWAEDAGYSAINLLSSGGQRGVEKFKASLGAQKLSFGYYLQEKPQLRAVRGMKRFLSRLT